MFLFMAGINDKSVTNQIHLIRQLLSDFCFYLETLRVLLEKKKEEEHGSI